MKRDYDSTVARIAGNLLSGLMANGSTSGGDIDSLDVQAAVRNARAIVAETKRTEPRDTPHDE